MRLACLNHAASVQAEPGSNSSIVFLGAGHILMPHATPLRERAESDTFRAGVIRETSLSRPVGPRLSNGLLLPRRRLRRQGQPAGALRHPRELQGSNISSIWLTQIYDQGRSLTCVRHEGMLEILSAPAFRPEGPPADDLDCQGRVSTPTRRWHTPSWPIPTIHLPKSFVKLPNR